MAELIGVALAIGVMLLYSGIWVAEQADQATRLDAARDARVYADLAAAVETYMDHHGVDLRDCLYRSQDDMPAWTAFSAAERTAVEAEFGSDFADLHVPVSDSDSGIAAPGQWLPLPLFLRTSAVDDLGSDFVMDTANGLGARHDCVHLPSLAQAGLLPEALHSLAYAVDHPAARLWGARAVDLRWYVRLVGYPDEAGDYDPAFGRMRLGLESLLTAVPDGDVFPSAYAATMIELSPTPSLGGLSQHGSYLVGGRGAWHLGFALVDVAARADRLHLPQHTVGDVHRYQLAFVPSTTAHAAEGGAKLWAQVRAARAASPDGGGMMAVLVTQSAIDTDAHSLKRYDLGSPEENRMRTHLDLGGFGLANAAFISGVDLDADGEIEFAPRLLSTNPSPGTVDAGDRPVTVLGDLHVTGDLRVDGQSDLNQAVTVGAAGAEADVTIHGSVLADTAAGSHTFRQGPADERSLRITQHLTAAGFDTLSFGSDAGSLVVTDAELRLRHGTADANSATLVLDNTADAGSSLARLTATDSHATEATQRSDVVVHARAGPAATRSATVALAPDYLPGEAAAIRPVAASTAPDDVQVWLPPGTQLAGRTTGGTHRPYYHVNDSATTRPAWAAAYPLRTRRLDVAIGPYSLAGHGRVARQVPKKCFLRWTDLVAKARPNDALVAGVSLTFRAPDDGDPSTPEVTYGTAFAAKPHLPESTAGAGDGRYLDLSDADCRAPGSDPADGAGFQQAVNASFRAGYAGMVQRAASAPPVWRCTDLDARDREVHYAIPTAWARQSVSTFGTLRVTSVGSGALDTVTYQVPLPYLGWVADHETGLDIGGDFDRIGADESLSAYATILRLCDWTRDP